MEKESKTKKLTVVIAFLNEEEEVKNTIEDVRKWVGDGVDIVVVNDCSDDGYDYDSDLKSLDIDYFVNPERLGAARSKALGISKIRTPYFLLLDAHMRFYDSNWVNLLVERLDENDRQILCCQTKVLRKSGNRVFEPLEEKFGKKKYGTFINFKEEPNILEPQWIYEERNVSSDCETTPCIYGAAYCASKRYWDYLKGYQGLLGFGLEEPYISMKVYLEGGQCVLMKNIVTGHIYRTKFPYRVNGLEYVYNKFMITELFLPQRMKDYIHAHYRQAIGDAYPKACSLLEENRPFLMDLKAYYQSIFISDFQKIYKMNHSFCQEKNESR